MLEVCPVPAEFIPAEFISNNPENSGSKDNVKYVNDGFRAKSANVGWNNISGHSVPVNREVVGRVAENVVVLADGTERIKVATYVRSYKGDYPLSLLGGRISRSWGNEKFEETEITELYSREYASTFTYSHFAADPEILFPGVEIDLLGCKVPSYS